MPYRRNPHGSSFESPPPPASAFAYSEQEFKRIGSVVDVRCDRAACTPLSAAAKAGGLLGGGLGLAAASGALLGAFAVIANRVPGRVLRRRWLRRALAGWFTWIGLLILVSVIAGGAS
jgi:hypothetical protein